MKINTLIIDDDPTSVRLMSRFVELTTPLHLVGTCQSATEAYTILAEQDVDLLICDIEMPELSGLGFARSLRNSPLLMFITAHPHYALDCYEVSPVDFLLKPIEYERFLRSIEQVRKRFQKVPGAAAVSPYFFIRDQRNYVQIAYRDVLYMKSQEHFIEIVTATKNYLPMLTMAAVEAQLKGDVFLRVHRSFLVHREAIGSVGRTELTLINGEVIPVGEQYRTKINQRHIGPHLLRKNA